MFKILLPESDEYKELSPYVIESSRGVRYALTRNVPRPEHLFGIKFNGQMGILPGWFTDKDGELKSMG